jgi:galactokinase
MQALADLRTAFEARFSADPPFLSRAPGRVNLIGEHTDYNDLPVLPMALQREVRIALRPREDGIVRLENTLDEFPTVRFEVSPAIEPSPPGHWGNYVKAPANELARRFAVWRGFDGVVMSDVPVASGLSSSSALVNAVGLALAHVNEVDVEPLALADIMADAERYTGTRGGGMDQAISLAAKADHAALIDFAPLRMRHVMVPPDWCFVVADTGVRAEKSGRVQTTYNVRRAECEEALQVVVAAVVERAVRPTPPQGYPALIRALGHGGALELGEAVLEANLARRFRHVVSEASRVRDARAALRNAEIMDFGDLMDASHGSLRTDYHVSSVELDELVALAKEGGAAGARLTGAGFGGCIVALADRSTVGGVLDSLTSGYYEQRHMGKDLDDHVFVAVPSPGGSFSDFPATS